MTAQEKAWQAAESAAAALAPDADVFGSVDAAGLGSSTFAVLRRAAAKPTATTSAAMRFWTSMAMAGPVAAARWMGMEAPPPVPVPESDKRFADKTWSDNPAFYALRQAHLATSRLVSELLEAGSGNAVDDAKAALATGFLLDALAPTNFLLTNPAALKRMFETGGASLVAGTSHFVDDVLNNKGRPRQVDTRPFRVGENLAATPGKVVFKNELMELIQYAPQTPKVHAIPVLASPPWINKYYVMDLAPGRSFLEWAVQHERTVFAISYRNPDASMGGTTLDDYLIHGPREALDVIAEITGAPKIDIIGLCLGGALTAMLAAYLAEKGDDRIGSITLLNTLLDYSEPGVLGAFTDEKTVRRLEKQMAEKGVLEASQMAGTFDMLRANDLIFSYVVSNWLMGQEPPAFDILAWNGDSTRMPSAMHSFYLRSLYMRNELARGELELLGQQLSLSSVKSDTYVVGAINDHIVPWHGSYKTGRADGWQRALRAVQRRPHRRHRQPARPEGLARGDRRRHGRRAGPGGVAPFRHQADWLVVGGLDRLVRIPRGRTYQAAAHGQQEAPGHRGRSWGVRVRLIAAVCPTVRHRTEVQGMADMNGQVALVTGGIRGIGLAIGERLMNRGVRVAAGYSSNRDAAQQFADKYADHGVTIHQGNIGSNADCERVIAEVLEQHGQLDILVNNAGVTVDKTMRKMTPEEWDHVIHVNLSGAFYLSRAILQHMLDRGYGRIVNISSVIGSSGGFGQANYASAKSGLFGLTMSLALETAAKGITVNAVTPGYITTDMTAAVPGNVMDKLIANIPVGRLGEPNEVARVVEFLADPESAYITGQVYPVNGGLYM